MPIFRNKKGKKTGYSPTFFPLKEYIMKNVRRNLNGFISV